MLVKTEAAKQPINQSQTPPFIRIEGVSKNFGTFQAVNNVNLNISKGEIFALLGGSGCGKTTLLRMLAGFETPSAGKIFLDGQDMTGIPPYERPVNMMFQSYALFPHMTVEKNIGYGLKHEKLTDAARRDRVREMLDLVQLTQFARRKPHQISASRVRPFRSGASAKWAALSAPTEDPTTRSGCRPASTSAISIPTCTAPRLPPPASTNAVPPVIAPARQDAAPVPAPPRRARWWPLPARARPRDN